MQFTTAWEIVEQAGRGANRLLVVPADVPGHAEARPKERARIVVVATIVVPAARPNTVQQFA